MSAVLNGHNGDLVYTIIPYLKVYMKVWVNVLRNDQKKKSKPSLCCETAEPNKQNEGRTGPLFAYFVCRPCETTSGCSEKLSLQPREKKTVEKPNLVAKLLKGQSYNIIRISCLARFLFSLRKHISQRIYSNLVKVI